MMVGFYYIDKEYARFLREVDPHVPSLDYDTHGKFFCGVVFSINGINYYAPISHNTQPQRTSMIIYHKDKAISSLKFAYMVPAPASVLTKLDFNSIAVSDPKYADLLRTEYKFCATNESTIIRKAESVYRIGCNKNHVLNKLVCDFALLEQKMTTFRK